MRIRVLTVPCVSLNGVRATGRRAVLNFVHGRERGGKAELVAVSVPELVPSPKRFLVTCLVARREIAAAARTEPPPRRGPSSGSPDHCNETRQGMKTSGLSFGTALLPSGISPERDLSHRAP